MVRFRYYIAMLKISKLADYATTVMDRMAMQPQASFSAAELALVAHIPVPTVRKILKLLNEANLLVSTRGSRGGYQLTRDATRISIGEIVTAIDGLPAITECSQKNSACSFESNCKLRGNWRQINKNIMHMLNEISLAEMNKPFKKEANEKAKSNY